MKKILLSLAAVAMIFAGCNKDFEDRISDLEDRVSDLEADVAELQDRVDGIRAIVDALEKNYYVTNVEEIKVENTDYVSGYRIYFNQGKDPIEIMHGNTGETGPQGDAGKTPKIDYDTENDYWFWAYTDGTPILDNNGGKIPVYRNIDFEVVDGKLYYTVDGTSTPIEAGNVQGDSWFTGVKVNAEAGTVTIGIVGSEHSLVLPFNAAAAEEKFEFQLAYNKDQVVYFGRTVELSYTYTTSDDVVVFATAPETWEATVDAQNKKVLLTIGDKSGYAVVYAINNTTGEFKAKTVSFNPEEMISLGITETEFWLDPDGKRPVEIPVSTGVLYEIMGPSWLHFNESSSRALTHKTILVTADPNTEAKERSFEVDFVKKDTETVLFRLKFSQKNYLEALFYDEEKQPVQWEESFKIQKSTSTTKVKNPVTIEFSDDYSKGTYKIKNLFKADNYWGPNGQLVYDSGADYYADVEGNVMTVHLSKTPKPSYNFQTDDLTLNVDLANMQITSASEIMASLLGSTTADVVISEYAIRLPKAGGEESLLAGSWTETFSHTDWDNNTTNYTNGEVTIEVDSDGAVTISNMFRVELWGSPYSGKYHGTVSEDGRMIYLIKENGSGSNGMLGPIDACTLTLSDDNKTLSISEFPMGVSNYKLTKNQN